MEYLREATVRICLDTNKDFYVDELVLCENDDNETMEEFLERVNKRMREIYLNEYE